MKLSGVQKGLFLLVISLIAIIFVNRLFLADVFNKEEAQHALYAASLCRDVKSFDVGGFFYDTQRQMYWPFLHSWLSCVSFLFLGVNYIAARLLSFIFFIATLWLMFLVSCHFSRRNGWKIGLFSVLLALSSPIMLRYSVENTLESLGAFLFIASYYLYSLREERKLTLDYVLLAILVGLSFYTNYLYAYLIIPAFIVMTVGKLGPIFAEAAHLYRRGEKAALPFFWWAYRKLIFLVVLMLMVSFWFLTPGFSRKLLLLFQAIFKYSGGELTPGLWQDLLFYPRAIIDYYAFSPWLGMLILLSLFLPFVAIGNRVLSKLYTFSWAVLVLATFTIPAKAPQMIYIIAPFMYMIFSAKVFYLLGKAGLRYRPVVLIVLFFPAFLSLPRLTENYFPQPPAVKMGQVLDYFSQTVPAGSSIAASMNLQHLNAEVLTFHFWDWKGRLLFDQIEGEEEMFLQGEYLLSLKIDEGEGLRSEVLDDSAFRWENFLQDKLRAGEAREIGSRSFFPLGLTARVYEKTKSLQRQ